MWKGLPGVGRHEMVVGRLNAAGVRKIRDGRAGRLNFYEEARQDRPPGDGSFFFLSDQKIEKD